MTKTSQYSILSRLLQEAQPVKICVRDVLDTKKLGYDYQPMDLPWLKSRPTPKRNRRPKPLKKVFSTIKNAVAAKPSSNTVVRDGSG